MVMRTDEWAAAVVKSRLSEDARGDGAGSAWKAVFADTETEYIACGHPEATEAVRLHYLHYMAWEAVAEKMNYGTKATRAMARKWVLTAALIAAMRGLIRAEEAGEC